MEMVLRNYRFCILIFFVISAFYACRTGKNRKTVKQPQFIQSIINNTPHDYHYQVHGSYNKNSHKINLRASDTLSPDAATIVLNIELGKDSTLDMLKFPRTFSSTTDTLPRRQITFAGVHWDNGEEDILYENYTFRSYSDLSLTIQSLSKDSLLTGSFSGSLWQKKKRARIREGRFQVYIKSK